ncbi:hypothetical protein ACGFZP_20620 [Kitasatospora sp. NPDC048239]|uniref:hypothetical protein n=1 Tax=Kitasatospora sp. NPDC048239 TaxID=3364046 RepID=UPI0037243118
MEDGAWRVVAELERLRPGIGAAPSPPRYESVHRMQVTHRQRAGAAYEAGALLTRAGGDPLRAADLVATDLAAPAAPPQTDPPPHRRPTRPRARAAACGGCLRRPEAGQGTGRPAGRRRPFWPRRSATGSTA